MLISRVEALEQDLDAERKMRQHLFDENKRKSIILELCYCGLGKSTLYSNLHAWKRKVTVEQWKAHDKKCDSVFSDRNIVLIDAKFQKVRDLRYTFLDQPHLVGITEEEYCKKLDDAKIYDLLNELTLQELEDFIDWRLRVANYK